MCVVLSSVIMRAWRDRGRSSKGFPHNPSPLEDIVLKGMPKTTMAMLLNVVSLFSQPASTARTLRSMGSEIFTRVPARAVRTASSVVTRLMVS